jgi:hypothetical protein
MWVLAIFGDVVKNPELDWHCALSLHVYDA